MKAQLLNIYRSSKGTLTGTYAVSGTEEELAAYKAAQGEYYRENEEGKPLFFNTRLEEGKSFALAISSSGNVFIKKTDDQIIQEAIMQKQMVMQAKATIQAKMSWGIALVEED